MHKKLALFATLLIASVAAHALDKVVGRRKCLAERKLTGGLVEDGGIGKRPTNVGRQSERGRCRFCGHFDLVQVACFGRSFGG